ncbi:MAG TPA: ABC transporter substrate-binding protein, partial [Anaerolineae bacterium]|nr:ABC transporter substrate-binding protein [Anaerolineae bacterium]
MAKIIDIVLAALVVLALITVAFFAAVLLINFLEGQSPPEVAPAEDSWQRVKAAGKLVVGTAADYPPFEYYVGRELIGGFDVALMNEIGQRLGVQVEYRNYAFDKLGNGLEEGKIDAAIAAISVTPERAALMDFSDVYYVTQDAVLTYFTTPVTVNRLADLAGYRVGVQKGTIY